VGKKTVRSTSTRTKAARSEKSALEASKPAGCPQNAATESAAKQDPVVDYKHRAKAVVLGKFADILEAMAEKSIQGSLPHIKYLFEIGGVEEEFQRRGDGSGEPSLADLLLAEVRRQRMAEGAVPGAAGNRGSDAETLGDKQAQVGERGGEQGGKRGEDCGAKAQ